MIKAGILGATGYAGIEVVRLLTKHKDVEITMLVSQSFKGKKISEVYPSLLNVNDMVCEELDAQKCADTCDVVFAALPHGASKEIIPHLYEKGLKIIDLSGDFFMKRMFLIILHSGFGFKFGNQRHIIISFNF